MHRAASILKLSGQRINVHFKRRSLGLGNVSIPAQHALVFSSVRSSNFHSSASSRNDAPKSPWQTFRETLQEEIRKNRGFEDNMKQLEGDVSKVQNSEALKAARTAYEKARLMTSIKENPRLRDAAEKLSKQGVRIGDAVSETLRTMEESEVMRAISRASSAVSSSIEKSTEPIRNTAAYKSLSDTIIDALDDSGSAKHAGYEAKEQRRQRRERRLAKAGLAGTSRMRTPANAEAGEALVLHKDNEKNERWEQLKQTNPFLRQYAEFRKSYDESENPVVSTMRTMTSWIGSLAEESEAAQVTKLLRTMDPGFTVEGFHRELREYIVPELVDAYLSADRESLREWCGEATYNVLWATMEVFVKQGLVPESQVLDIRNVDVSTAKFTEDQLPVFVVTFNTQEILMFRNKLTNEIAVGAPDKVEQCTYAAVITRLEEELDNELTAGWKVIEMGRRSARSYL